MNYSVISDRKIIYERISILQKRAVQAVGDVTPLLAFCFQLAASSTTRDTLSPDVRRFNVVVSTLATANSPRERRASTILAP